jgi:hypothetical protein
MNNTILTLLRKIDDEKQVGWDTISELSILSQFIESRKLHKEFQEYVETMADFDVENSLSDDEENE